MYDLPGRADIGKCVINAETVNQNANPTLVPRSGKRSRPRRAAS
jgi:ATP-dependent protease Clp ATPase subunit